MNKKYQNKQQILQQPIQSTIIVFWFISVMFCSLVVFLKLNHFEYLGFNNLTFGILLLFGFFIAMFFTTTIWSIRTFKARALRYAEEFTNEMEKEKARSIHLSRLSAMGEMAAGIAHEINNPLTIILGKNKIIQRELSKESLDTTKISESTDKINSSATRITKIIDSMKNITRDTSRDEMQEQNLYDLVSSTYEMVDAKIIGKGITFELICKVQNPRILCHPTEISQVLINLFNNSIHAIEDSKIKKITITIVEESAFLILFFTDSGEPIPPEIGSKIMTPFFTTKIIGQGTGLGLSISQSIIERHRGFFFYDGSFPATTFVIKLPTLPIA